MKRIFDKSLRNTRSVPVEMKSIYLNLKMRMMIDRIAFALLWLCSSHAAKAQTSVSISVSTGELQQQYAALRSAKDIHSKTLHSYLLNNAADEYAHELNRKGGRFETPMPDLAGLKSRTQPEVGIANSYGASIFWCEYDGDWTVRPQGYLDYLSEWPDGPYAEEAWWRGRLGHKLNGCFDAEGSEEETVAFVHDYTEFLMRFPHGRHEAEARKLLKGFRADLESYKQQKRQ